jgi:hypothetical protein
MSLRELARMVQLAISRWNNNGKVEVLDHANRRVFTVTQLYCEKDGTVVIEVKEKL